MLLKTLVVYMFQWCWQVHLYLTICITFIIKLTCSFIFYFWLRTDFLWPSDNWTVIISSPSHYQEKQDKVVLLAEMANLRQNNQRLQEESQTASEQLRKFSKLLTNLKPGSDPEARSLADSQREWPTAEEECEIQARGRAQRERNMLSVPMIPCTHGGGRGTPWCHAQLPLDCLKPERKRSGCFVKPSQ